MYYQSAYSKVRYKAYINVFHHVYNLSADCLKKEIFCLKGEQIQSTLVISKSKGLSGILRDIRTSTYQICRNEENIYLTTTFHE